MSPSDPGNGAESPAPAITPPPLRVALLSNLLHRPCTGVGGVERWGVELANGLRARGAEVWILANAPLGSRPWDERLDPRVRVQTVGGSRGMAILNTWRWALHHPDTVLVSASPRYNLIASDVRRLPGLRLHSVLTAHEHLTHATAQQSPARQRRRRRELRPRYAAADAVVAVSAAIGDDLVEHWGVPRPRLHLIYNPLSPMPALGAPPHPWLRERTTPVVLAAGRLTDAKGFDTLLAAFARLREVSPARLLLCGEGPLQGALEARIAQLGLGERVQLPGHVAPLHDYLGHADLFVLSSRYEGLPYVLLEALQAGCPVVSTDCPSGPAEILEQGRYGELVPVDDADALATAIGAALGSGRAAVQARLQQRAAAFSAERAVSAYESLFRSLLAPRPGSAAAAPTRLSAH